jgi:hypothetical protein
MDTPLNPYISGAALASMMGDTDREEGMTPSDWPITMDFADSNTTCESGKKRVFRGRRSGRFVVHRSTLNTKTEMLQPLSGIHSVVTGPLAQVHDLVVTNWLMSQKLAVETDTGAKENQEMMRICTAVS